MNDRRIISAIINRDEQMLSYVVRKYSKLLWKIAASILINAASAQDVEECVADVFIYLWQYPEKYNPEKAKLFSWLSMVARSRAVNSRYIGGFHRKNVKIRCLHNGMHRIMSVFYMFYISLGRSSIMSCI